MYVSQKVGGWETLGSGRRMSDEKISGKCIFYGLDILVYSFGQELFESKDSEWRGHSISGLGMF